MDCHVYVRGEIGSETTPKNFLAQIDKSASEFVVHVNSIGGDVYDGIEIGSILLNLGKPVTAFIEGQCASIATYITSCCDKVIMTPHGDFMIHDPTAEIRGRSSDLKAAGAQLDRIKTQIIDRYMKKVAKKGMTQATLSAMMDKETSMSAEEALAAGFVDEVQEKLKAVAKWNFDKFNQMDNNKELKGWFDTFSAKLDKILGLKAKNEMAYTLEDGTQVMVMADTAEGMMGADIVGPDGAPLPDGTYNTREGWQLVVAGGKVTASTKMEAKEDDKMKEENEALKKKVAELEGQLKAKGEEVAAANGKVAAVNKDLKEIKAEFENLKKGTFGDPEPPAGGRTDKKFENEDEVEFDPMAELGQNFINDSPFIKRKQA